MLLSFLWKKNEHPGIMLVNLPLFRSSWLYAYLRNHLWCRDKINTGVSKPMCRWGRKQERTASRTSIQYLNYVLKRCDHPALKVWRRRMHLPSYTLRMRLPVFFQLQGLRNSQKILRTNVPLWSSAFFTGKLLQLVSVTKYDSLPCTLR